MVENNFKKCKKCGHYHYVNEQCPEPFIVKDKDYLIKPIVLFGLTHKQIAKHYLSSKKIVSTVGSIPFSITRVRDQSTIFYKSVVRIQEVESVNK